MATHSKIFYFVCESQKKKLKLLQWIWGKAFISWVKENLPPAQIVFNHFHVIKLMNEKLDLVRRRITVKLDTAERAILKNQRFTLLRNEENLSSEASAYLAKIKQTFQELADVHMMKEALRSIYSVAQNVSQAEDALLLWVKAT
ncbi:transposase [Victivallis vadensis]|uniref:Transposase n=1 Tax=Victivallis vadensis TaxID=172901 RepID=A0A848B592_9BACT|nr:transposase [Victivallis vadensis]